MAEVRAHEIYDFIASKIKNNRTDPLLSEKFRDALKYNISNKLPNSLTLYITLLAKYIVIVGGIDKIHSYNLATQEDSEALLHRYQNDPSDFHTMLLHATTCLLRGDRSRACQLYDRLMRTQWGYKHLATTMIKAIEVNESNGNLL